MPNSKSKQQLSERFVLRLPSGLRGRVAQKARQNHRSMNSEILHALGIDMDAINSGKQDFPTSTPPPERLLLGIFRTLSATKQSALIELLDSNQGGEEGSIFSPRND